MRTIKSTLVCLSVFLMVLTLLAHKSQSESGYVIGRGDVLLIRVWGDEDPTREVVVSPEGQIPFPLIGEVAAEGRSAEEVRRTITERLADGYLVNPQVEVVIKEYKSQKVYVLGQIVRPGTYPLESRASVLEIISRAGGLTEDAGDVAQIIRGQEGWNQGKPLQPDQEGVEEVITVDLRRMLAGKLGKQTIEVRHGDTIFVPKSAVFYIFGEVNQPGKYRWEEELTVLKAVIIAGGFTDIASKRRMKIRRKDSEGEKKIRGKLDTLVEPGDTVIVPESFF